MSWKSRGGSPRRDVRLCACGCGLMKRGAKNSYRRAYLPGHNDLNARQNYGDGRSQRRGRWIATPIPYVAKEVAGDRSGILGGIK